MARKKFRDLDKMVEYILADPKMQNEVIMMNDVPVNTLYLKECLNTIGQIKMRLRVGDVITPLEHLALEMIMQTFGVELG